MAVTHFTPAPWHAEESPRIYGDSTRIKSDGQTLALVPPDCTIEIEDGAVAEALSPAAKANARLIAAAPDLYTVLDAFLSDLDEYGEVGFTLRQRARALLNKVEGLTP